MVWLLQCGNNALKMVSEEISSQESASSGGEEYLPKLPVLTSGIEKKTLPAVLNLYLHGKRIVETI